MSVEEAIRAIRDPEQATYFLEKHALWQERALKCEDHKYNYAQPKLEEDWAEQGKNDAWIEKRVCEICGYTQVRVKRVRPADSQWGEWGDYSPYE